MTHHVQIDLAHQFLSARGFMQDGEIWKGTLDVAGRDVSISIRLPDGFPLCLPEVKLDEPQRRERMWLHVAADGKICVGPSTGFTIDDSRPADIVDYVLSKAARALADTFSDQFAVELQAEFGAYWSALAEPRTAVVARIRSAERVVAVRRSAA